MNKVVGEFDKCDECEALIDVYVEFHSRRGDFVKVCMNCLASGLTPRAPDVCPECAGSGKTGSIGLPRECPYCDGTGKRR